jgi:hypothetical protein
MVTGGGGHEGWRRRLRNRMPDWLFYRLIGEPVWLYLFWITLCVVLAIGTTYSILSGSVPCPDPTSGC